MNLTPCDRLRKPSKSVGVDNEDCVILPRSFRRFLTKNFLTQAVRTGLIKMGSGPILVIYHSGIPWHPAGLYPIYIHNPCVTTLMRWGHGRSVAPETASM